VWHKLDAARVSSTERYFYVDGVLVVSSTTDAGSVSSSGNLPFRIGLDANDQSPCTSSTMSLARLSGSGSNAIAPDATQVRQAYDAEKGMFVASAECLLQSGTTDAVIDVDVDPLTNKVIVTQTDAITIFDGLVVDSKPTVNSGASEKGKLWGDLRAEQNAANAYVTAPATDQRQVNEMVRSLANDMPAGVDMSKAKAWVMFEDDATVVASYNVKSVGSAIGSKHYVTWGIPFKSEKYVILLCSFDPSTTPRVMDVKVQTKYLCRTNAIDVGDIANTADVYYVVAFGELENE
jgi:hypothetical protein